MDKLNKMLHAHIESLEQSHVQDHDGYEFYRRRFLHRGQAGQCLVNIYEIPPGKSAYPYHYHCKNEEVFYIVQGSGLLRTPEGERTVSSGDLLFFPAEPGGAHKLTNHGETPLVYIDFDAVHDLDVAIYPDSHKIGVWGKEINQLFCQEDEVDYFKGE